MTAQNNTSTETKNDVVFAIESNMSGEDDDSASSGLHRRHRAYTKNSLEMSGAIAADLRQFLQSESDLVYEANDEPSDEDRSNSSSESCKSGGNIGAFQMVNTTTELDLIEAMLNEDLPTAVKPPSNVSMKLDNISAMEEDTRMDNEERCDDLPPLIAASFDDGSSHVEGATTFSTTTSNRGSFVVLAKRQEGASREKNGLVPPSSLKPVAATFSGLLEESVDNLKLQAKGGIADNKEQCARRKTEEAQEMIVDARSLLHEAQVDARDALRMKLADLSRAQSTDTVQTVVSSSFVEDDDTVPIPSVAEARAVCNHDETSSSLSTFKNEVEFDRTVCVDMNDEERTSLGDFLAHSTVQARQTCAALKKEKAQELIKGAEALLHHAAEDAVEAAIIRRTKDVPDILHPVALSE